MNHNQKTRKICFILLIITTAVYLTWRIFFTIPFGENKLSFLFGIVLLIVEIIGVFEAVIHFYNMSKIEIHSCPEADLDKFPDIDVFIATYNEPAQLLLKTVNACARMEYPDKRKVHIYLCDDSNRSEIKQLAFDMNIGYITRTEHKDAKAGNLNHAMKHTNSPLIATFDADMIPMSDFLMAVVPYFVSDELCGKVGFVQTPQSFYNPDLFQFNLFSESRIPNEQDYFYKDVQVSRNKSNSVIYGGSNTVLLRKALEEAGGFYTGVITEDFATGIAIQKKGYLCYATSEVHASGLSPMDLKSLILQRRRWARGCIQSGRKLHLIFSKGLKLSQKLNYLASITYWYGSVKRFIYILAPILFGLFQFAVIECTLPEVLLFWLPMYFMNHLCLRMLSGRMRTVKWSNIYETILFPFLMPAVILETFGISQKKFAVTKKGKKEKEESQWIYVIPHLIFAALSLVSMINCVVWIFKFGTADLLVVIFWLVINFYYILMSIFFLAGRKSRRKEERSRAEIDCVISDTVRTVSAKTYDFSEGGFSVILEHPIFIDPKETVKAVLKEHCETSVLAQIVNVSEGKEGWKYSFCILFYGDEENALHPEKQELSSYCCKKEYLDYLQIIYDRVPTLPDSLDGTESSFDDLRLNFRYRMKRQNSRIRVSARIPFHCKAVTTNNEEIHLLDFNYNYLLIESEKKREKFQLNVNENLRIDCSFERETKENKLLYRINNQKGIVLNRKIRKEFELWAHQREINYKEQEDKVGSLKKSKIEKERLNDCYHELIESVY